MLSVVTRSRQHLDLASRSGSAMAAHGGHDEGRAPAWISTPRVAFHLLEIGDSAAADAKSDSHAA